MISINIKNETSRLKSVILGTAEGFGGTPEITAAYDPKSKQHIKNGTFPTEEELVKEIDQFSEVLERYGVHVYRPEVIPDCNQIFTRDIGFVIDNKFIKSNILEKRQKEVEGIDHLVRQISPDQIIRSPETVRIEGGDVMPWNDHLFVGYSRKADFDLYEVSRTNEGGVNFLREIFPNRIVKAFELNKSDQDPRQNALHLDCCFQPIGNGEAIIYKDGFKNESDYHFLVEYFGNEHIIDIDTDEMYHMNSNIFSISPSVIVSEKGFTRLNTILKEKGYKVEEIKYSENAKMEGLLRCSTLPLLRE